MKVRVLVAAAAVSTAAVTLLLNVGKGMDTDIYSLASDDNGDVLSEVAGGMAGRGRVLVEGPEDSPQTALADSVAAELDVKPSAGHAAEMIASLSHHTAGLLAPGTREKLLSGRYSEVAADSIANLYGFMHPLFPVKEDPFLLATGFVLSLQSGMSGGWTLKDGYPCCRRDGRSFVIVNADLSHVPQSRLSGFLARARSFNAGEADFGLPASDAADRPRIWCGGSPFHAACTAGKARREINILSLLSVFAVLVVGWRLLGSFRFVLPLIAALAVAVLFAVAALFAVFPRPHVLTFVFGTSLIGLSVDYVYHSYAAGGSVNVRRPLTCAMLTTVAAFFPLLFSSVDVLRQMSLFAVSGLIAMWAWVVMFMRRTPECEARRSPSAFQGRRGVIAGILMLMAALPGILRVEMSSSPTAFYRPNAYLAASERKLSELAPDGRGRFVYVRADTLQKALEKEESAGIKGLSAVIPSLSRQRENRGLAARLYAIEGPAFAAKTGLRVNAAEAEGDGNLLDPELLDDSRLQGLVRAAWTGRGLLSPCPDGFVSNDPDMLVLDPGQSVKDMFSRFTRTTLRLLAVSLAALSVLLLLLFRRRFLRVVLPVVTALAATAGVLGWLGVPVTFFTMLCAFVLTGLGMDYAIFQMSGEIRHEDDGRSIATSHAVFCSFLTSFTGLGALSLTDFAVTRYMGLTFAVGLFFSYFFAKFPLFRLIGHDTDGDVNQDCAWHARREQSAGSWRLWFMWFVYRWFGKGLQKVLCVPVMMFIYPFARPAKEALREYYSVLDDFNGHKSLKSLKDEFRLFRHLLGFAWSMADKTDACSLKRNLPRMTVREDDAWRSFDSLTRSGKGAFIISTHLGTVEVLPALPRALGRQNEQPHLHAFRQMGHDAMFTKVFMRHFDSSHLTPHAVEDIGVETAVAMQEAISRGDLVLMAGDRVSAGSGKMLRHDFLGRSCVWPKGVFAFARMMDAPVFFVTCLNTGWNSYEVHFGKMTEGGNDGKYGLEDLLDAYVGFLEHETLARPDQWYQFYDFFK